MPSAFRDKCGLAWPFGPDTMILTPMSRQEVGETRPSESAPVTGSHAPEKKPETKRAPWVLLAGGLGAAVVLALVASPTARTTNTPPGSPAEAPPAAANAPAPAADVIAGEAREVIEVAQYTYLRIATAGGERWAAVPKTKISTGQKVVIANPQRMTKFTSSTLNRTFDEIYFGTLGSESATGEAVHREAGPVSGNEQLPPGHPPIDGGAAAPNPHAGVPGAPSTDPHGAPTALGDSVPVGKVRRAEGQLGRTVAEAHSQSSALKGKLVRVRGVVVKSVPGVMGKTFIHVRDGSGESGAGTHDLTVTLQETPVVGSSVLLEGTLATDKDFGSGYRYGVLLENARVLPE
jgi:hypothetical protein